MILGNVWGPGYVTELHYLKVTGYGANWATNTGNCCRAIPRSGTGSHLPATVPRFL